MRQLTSAAVSIMSLIVVCACDGSSEPASPAETVYGTASPGADPVTISDLVARPRDHDGKTVRVEGTVTDVCAKRGCWIRIGADQGADTLTFKVTDGVLVFPMSERGRYAVAEGVARAVTLDLEGSRAHLAARAKADGREFDPGTVTAPVTTVRLDGLHARIRDRK